MIRKITHSLMALTMVVGAGVASVQPAEAGRGGNVAAGVAAGIIGLGILGAYANARDRRYYGNCYQVGGGCYWREGRCFINRFGEEVCRRGYRVCEPVRTVCD